jgi:7-cyano-7-deazaguanine synthase
MGTGRKAVVILSGGLDSTVLAHLLDKGNFELFLTSFDYGQRHKRELEFAKKTATTLGARHAILDLQHVGSELSGSSLTDMAVDVPDGHYSEESMKATVVPNRNAIMLSIAYGIAVANRCHVVAAAFHTGDHTIYPDCRIEFVTQLGTALAIGNEWADPVPQLHVPFIMASKQQIVTMGHRLQVPFEDSFSCYRGGEVHCGSCGTCTERIEAFRLADVPDPTVYDPKGLKKYSELVVAGKVAK